MESSTAGKAEVLDGFNRKRDILKRLLLAHQKLADMLQLAVLPENEPDEVLGEIERLQHEVDELDRGKQASGVRIEATNFETEHVSESMSEPEAVLVYELVNLLHQIDRLNSENASNFQRRLLTMNDALEEVSQKKKYISGYAPNYQSAPRYFDQKR